MNLHGIARGVVGAVNPEVAGVLKVCTGSTVGTAGRRAPTYAAAAAVSVQVQDLSQRDILHLDSLNIQGSQKVLYLSGQVSGMVRSQGKGNDLVVLNGGSETWAVLAVLEQWPDWCKVAVVLQNGG